MFYSPISLQFVFNHNVNNYYMVTFVLGAHGGAVGSGNTLQAGRSWVRFLVVLLEFFIDTILPASKKNEYQGYFLGHKDDWCVGLTLPPSCADCLEIWKPQPPGTLRTCPGLYRDCFTFTLTFVVEEAGLKMGTNPAPKI
jgi:hypothetical protein